MVKTWGWLNLLLWLTAALALDFGQYIIPLWYIKTELSRWCKEESSCIKHQDFHDNIERNANGELSVDMSVSCAAQCCMTIISLLANAHS